MEQCQPRRKELLGIRSDRGDLNVARETGNMVSTGHILVVAYTDVRPTCANVREVFIATNYRGHSAREAP